MKTEQEDYAGWLSGIISKRTPDILRVLLDVVEAGMKNGHASANDVKTAVTHPNAIGAAFKLVKRIGFESTGEIIKTTKPSSHKRFVFKYRLARSDRASLFIERTRSHLLGIAASQETQPRLAL